MPSVWVPAASTAGTPGNIGPPFQPGRARCASCGRFLPDDWAAFDDHMDRDCPAPKYWNGRELRPVRRAA